MAQLELRGICLEGFGKSKFGYLVVYTFVEKFKSFYYQEVKYF